MAGSGNASWLYRRLEAVEHALAPSDPCDACDWPQRTPILMAWPGFTPDPFCPECGREAIVQRFSFCPLPSKEDEYIKTYWQRQAQGWRYEETPTDEL